MSATEPAHPHQVRQGLGLRGLVQPAIITGVVACGAAYLYAVDPSAPGGYPPCVFHLATGLWCPGCGSARALHALVHLDVVTALARNPFAVLASLYIAWTFYRWSYRRVTGTPLRLAPQWVITVVWVSIVAFWVLRNVPGMTWLSPL